MRTVEGGTVTFDQSDLALKSGRYLFQGDFFWMMDEAISPTWALATFDKVGFTERRGDLFQVGSGDTDLFRERFQTHSLILLNGESGHELKPSVSTFRNFKHKTRLVTWFYALYGKPSSLFVRHAVQTDQKTNRGTGYRQHRECDGSRSNHEVGRHNHRKGDIHDLKDKCEGDRHGGHHRNNGVHLRYVYFHMVIRLAR